MIDEPNVGEAHRRIDRLEARLDGRVVSLNTYQAEQGATRAAIANTHADLGREIAELRADLSKIEERLTWAWRAAVTGVLLPLILTVGLLIFRGAGQP